MFLQIDFVYSSKSENQIIKEEKELKEKSQELDLDLILPDNDQPVYYEGFRPLMIETAQNAWRLCANNLENFFNERGIQPPVKVICYLTCWGTGGRYLPAQNAIVVRMHRIGDFLKVGDSILHEFIHLALHKRTKNWGYQKRENYVGQLTQEFLDRSLD